RESCRHVGGVHALQQYLLPLPNVFHPQPIFLQDANRFRIDEREIGTRKDYRHAPEEFFVEHLRLRVVGNFGRPAEVCDRGQQIVLHDRTKDGVGTEALRLGLDFTKPGVARRRFLAADKLTVGGGDHLALPSTKGKQKRAARGDVHLYRVARVLQLFAALQEKVVQLVALDKRP